MCKLHVALACEYVVVRQPHYSAGKETVDMNNLITGKDPKILFYNILLRITHRKGSYPKLL